MSIATEIQRLQTAKAEIKSAIEEKGVEVGNGLIDTYAEKISEISGGGGVMPYYTFRPASPTKEVSFPYENLPDIFSIAISPDSFPAANSEHFACVELIYSQFQDNARNFSVVVYKNDSGISTGNVSCSYSNGIVKVRDTYATFLPEYTYNVFIVTR